MLRPTFEHRGRPRRLEHEVASKTPKAGANPQGLSKTTLCELMYGARVATQNETHALTGASKAPDRSRCWARRTESCSRTVP